ncbi:MAG: DUF2950 domain-containing protein [Betaproteobacteria bacterium]|jgi:hypothetical protein
MMLTKLFHTLRLAATLLLLGAATAQAAAPATQKTFPTPEAAMNAFGDALATSNEDALRGLFGADFRKDFPPLGAEVRYRFLATWARVHGIKMSGADKAQIAVGEDGWTFPIPLVKTAQGWRFDMAAGAEEMRVRRIGRNELAVMQTMLAIIDAQIEYASVDRDGSGFLQYARRFASSPGKNDGLYWPTPAGAKPSPLGPAFEAAQAKGGNTADGYYGYRYRMLLAQGPNAPGGARDYVVRDRMIGGFAAIAWPVRYGDTGVMTFIVSQNGEVYEKDLGPDTAARAAAIARFDPGEGWKRVQPE